VLLQLHAPTLLSFKCCSHIKLGFHGSLYLLNLTMLQKLVYQPKGDELKLVGQPETFSTNFVSIIRFNRI
jgi:hypothetical protein